MKRDFRTGILLLLFAMPVVFALFIAAIYIGNCGFSTDCSQASRPLLIHTPIPTLIPATMPAFEQVSLALGTPKCTVTARTLLAAWGNAGYPEEKPFDFIDLNGSTCEGTFQDVDFLLREANIWYSGAISCVTCHQENLSVAGAQLDLSSYAGIIAGSRRASADVKGNDILGGGNWENSKLNEVLFVTKLMPFGRLPGAVPEDGPTILAGSPKPSQ